MAAALSYLILFVVGVLALQKADAEISKEMKEKLRESVLPIVTKCAAENQISMEKFRQAKDKRIVPTADGANACFFACFFRAFEMIDEKGLYSKEKAVEKGTTLIGPGEELVHFQETAKICNSVNEESVTDGERGCNRAKLLFFCMKNRGESSLLDLISF